MILAGIGCAGTIQNNLDNYGRWAFAEFCDVYEIQTDFETKVEKVWRRREEFLRINPAGTVPVLVEPDHTLS